QHHCKLFSWLCPKRKTGPLPSSQLPTALFPATYASCLPSGDCVQPTPQASGGSCEALPQPACRRPCRLKSFLHKVTCPGQECGCSCKSCGALQPAAWPSPQGHASSPQVSTASPQGNPSYRPRPLVSADPEPRDVPKAGKVGEALASQGLDESPQ